MSSTQLPKAVADRGFTLALFGFSGEKHAVAINRRYSDHLLVAKPQLLQKPDRGLVGGRCDGQDHPQAKGITSVFKYGASSLKGVSLGPVFSEEGKSDVGVLKRVSPDKTTDPNGDLRPFQLHQVEAVAELRVTRGEFLKNVRPRMLQRPNAAITYVLKVRGFVHQKEGKCVVRYRNLPQGQSGRFDHENKRIWFGCIFNPREWSIVRPGKQDDDSRAYRPFFSASKYNKSASFQVSLGSKPSILSSFNTAETSSSCAEA